jgi:hypothetical protein
MLKVTEAFGTDPHPHPHPDPQQDPYQNITDPGHWLKCLMAT